MFKRRWLNSALTLCALASFTAALPVRAEEAKKEGEKKVEAGYKKGGFYIQSPDEKYKIVIGGYAQFHLEYERIDGQNDFTFRVRRARLAWSGNLFGKDFTYKFQIELAKKSPQLLDAYVDYKIFGDDFRVQVGQFKIPFVRQNIISSSSQMFNDRSIASRFFLPDVPEFDGDEVSFLKDGRDIGLMLHGTPFDKKLEYQVAFMNGSGINTTNFNNHLLYVGRLVYNIKGYVGYELEGDFDYTEKPAVFVGASANYNVRDVFDDDVAIVGAEAGVKYRGFAATGEFFYRFTDFGAAGEGDTNDTGYYVQAGYFFIPKRLEVGARASQIFLDGPDNNKGEYQLGINGYIYDTRLKVQTDYSLLTSQNNEDDQLDHRWRLRLQVKL